MSNETSNESNQPNPPAPSASQALNIPPSPRRPHVEEPIYQTLMMPLGILMVYFAVVAWMLVPDEPILRAGLFIMGIVFMIVNVVMRPEGAEGLLQRAVHWSRGYQFLNLILVAAVIGCAVLINVVAYRHSRKMDFTMNQAFSLSDQTKQLLAGLKDEVTVTAFYPDYRGASQEAQLFQLYRKKMKDVLEDFSRFGSGKFKYEMADPLKDPITAKKFQLGEGEWGTVFVEQRGGRKVKVAREKVFARSSPFGGPSQFKGEEAITGALLELQSGKKITVYFVQGHGERTIESDQPTGYSTLKPHLERERYVVKSLRLLTASAIPDDCDVLIVPGPTKPFQPKEIDLIRKYVNTTGKGAIFLVDYTPVAGMKEFLAEIGIEWSPNIIIESDPGYQIENPLTFVATPKDHAITKDLVKNGLGLAFSEATYLNKLARPAEKFEFTPIVETTGNLSWAEFDLNSISTGRIRMDPGVDKPGPLPLGYAIEIKQGPAKPEDKKPDDPFHQKKEDEKKDDTPKSRVVAIGNSAFPSDMLRMIGANTDLFMNSVAWCAFSSEKTASIRPKDEPAPTLTLTADKTRRIIFFAIFVYPLTVVVIGVLVWFRRSSL